MELELLGIEGVAPSVLTHVRTEGVVSLATCNLHAPLSQKRSLIYPGVVRNLVMETNLLLAYK